MFSRFDTLSYGENHYLILILEPEILLFAVNSHILFYKPSFLLATLLTIIAAISDNPFVVIYIVFTKCF